MNVPLSWLRDFVDIDLPPRELAARLTMAGVEVEALHEIGAEWDKVYVGYVETRRATPERRPAEPGARGGRRASPDRRHRRAEYRRRGRRCALALVGARLWDGHAEEPKRMTLKASTIRGMPSEGMVCSEKELGLSEEHEGIWSLPDDAPVGVPLQDYLGDTVFELEITPNLVHDFSVLGVAREVGGADRQPAAPAAGARAGDRRPAATGPTARPLVTVADPDLCPRYVGVVIEGVTVGPSPDWLQQRLALAGLRAINNIADITNYVMLEYGQPLHAFDRDRLRGGRIVVRRAATGETLETLDHVQRTLDDRMLAICDAERPVGAGRGDGRRGLRDRRPDGRMCCWRRRTSRCTPSATRCRH